LAPKRPEKPPFRKNLTVTHGEEMPHATSAIERTPSRLVAAMRRSTIIAVL
jgi:hypothetical protein